MQTTDHQCIYSQYKICMQKYFRLKKMFDNLRTQNKTMEKELKEMRKALISSEGKDKQDVIIDIKNDCETADDVFYCNEEISDVEDKYELV